MALGISILTAFGFLAAYWKIRSITRINAEGSPVNIILDGFKDQDARDSGASPMMTRSYQAPGAEIDVVEADDEVSKAYIWVKTNVPEFTGATDVQP